MKINMPVTDNEVVLKDGQMIVSTTDLKGRISYVNQDFIDISGFTEEELIGKNHNIIRHPDMPSSAFKDLWDRLKSNRPWVGMVKNRCKNGDYYWVQANITPLFENGYLTSYMSVRNKASAEDIREAEQLYAKLNSDKNAAINGRSLFDKWKNWPMIKKLHSYMMLIAFMLTAIVVYKWDGNYFLPVMDVLTYLFFYAVMWTGIKNIQHSVSAATESLQQMIQGNYTEFIDISQNNELGQLRQVLKTAQIKLGFDLNDAVKKLATSQRIETALDNVTACVMVADRNSNIIYMNDAVENMFKNVEDELKQDLPDFNADRLMGANMDVFHRNPAHQREMIARMKQTHKARIVTGGRSFDLVATPVFDNNEERLGTAVEWHDVTAQVAIEREIDDVVGAVTVGQFNRKISLKGKEGFMRSLSSNINSMIDVVADGLEEVEDVMSVLAQGDLTMRVSDGHEGGFGRLADNINETGEQLLQTVASIRESSDQIATAANEIAIGNTSMSQRTEEQAASLEETASSMEEFTSTVKQNSDNAQQANQLAAGAREQAEKGGQVVSSAVAAMDEINESSTKIADIIGVINDIAFQTNLLALNASVEAARAGEQGRGFAVVATEVRNLAQRSAQAAKEIRGLIQDSENKVKAGSELVNESGRTLEEIVTSVKKVGDIVSEIAAASREQSIGIDQVNKAVGQMDEVTQQNAALAEQTSAASESLNDQARKMNGLMGFCSTESSGDKNKAVEFSAMRRAHLAWKSKLRDFLDGKGTLTINEVASHKDCQLGKWLYGGALKEYGHLAGMSEMEKIHADMHAAIKSVVEEKDGGNTSQAERQFNDVSNMSEQVVAYLSDIAANIKQDSRHIGSHNHTASGSNEISSHNTNLSTKPPLVAPAIRAVAVNAAPINSVADDEWEEF